MQRIGFLIKVKPDYLRRPQAGQPVRMLEHVFPRVRLENGTLQLRQQVAKLHLRLAQNTFQSPYRHHTRNRNRDPQVIAVESHVRSQPAARR